MKKNALKSLVLKRKYQLLTNPIKGDRYVYQYGRVEAGYEVAVKAMPNDDAKGIANLVAWY